MSQYEKAVKGATKIRVAAPKAKYLEVILSCTLSIDFLQAGFHKTMAALDTRLRDSAWLVVYKALIVIHIMFREGDVDVALKYLAEEAAPTYLNLSRSPIAKVSGFSTETRYILKYSRYLQTRVKHFAQDKFDFVRDPGLNDSSWGARVRTLLVEKGLLRECESIQSQIDSLLKNSFLEAEIKNDIILTAFRLLVNDLLALFQELNEGVINILEHYFEMSYYDAKRALNVYKKFVDQTKYVIDYLRVAKHLEYATKLHVPTIKHAPTALTSSLEEYLNDPMFEQHRAEYLRSKKQDQSPGLSPQVVSKQKPAQQESSNGNVGAAPQAAQQTPQPVANESSLQRSNTLVVQQATFNPWGSSVPVVFNGANMQNPQMLSLDPTGAGFGGVGQQHQLQQQQLQQQQLQQQQFQQQQLQQQQMQQQQMQQQQMQQQQAQQQQAQQQQFYNPTQQPFAPQATGQNPFLRSDWQPVVQQYTGFQNLQQPSQQSAPSSQVISAQTTQSNPFLHMSKTGSATANVDSNNPFGGTRFGNPNTTAYTFNKPEASQRVSVTATGSNPFKVSDLTAKMFESASKKGPLPIKAQPTAGGLENLPTIPVFPQTQQDNIRQSYINQAKFNLVSQATGQQVAPQYQQMQHTQFQQQPQMMMQQTRPVSLNQEPSLI